MFCPKCGKEMSDYQVCGSDIFLIHSPLDKPEYDPKTGEKLFHVLVNEFAEGYCKNWRHRELDGRKLFKQNVKYSDAIISEMKVIKEDQIVNGQVIIGKCTKLCCPHCGDTKPPSGGCFIATAVYGSAFAEEVVILRNFRDEILSSSKVGCIFIKLYYRISPPIANFIAEYDYLKTIIRKVIVAPTIMLARKLIQASDTTRQ